MTVSITAGQLRRFAPVPDLIISPLALALTEECNRHGISDNRRLRHFMATTAHECAGYRSMVESLNYSVEGLMDTFGRHRISAEDCRKFGRASGRPAHQNAIANIIYGGDWGRKNLGNTQPGDGWRYRGRGPMMVTGRANYAAMERLTGFNLVANPDQLAQPAIGVRVAAAWWKSSGLNEIADADAGERLYSTVRERLLKNELDDMTAIRQRVNGGKIGLKDVQDWLLRAGQIWP